MSLWQKLKHPPWRTIVPLLGVLLVAVLAYRFWSPGLDVRDGRHDRGRNGIWLSHGWLGADEWFTTNNKTNQLPAYRDEEKIRALAECLREQHITDVFPHLCPADITGPIPSVNAAQVERFLDAFNGFRVMPWIGGPNGGSVRAQDAGWRAAFLQSVTNLLAAHPRLAGVQVNVEPMTSGDQDFLKLLEDLRAVLPKDKLISVAAYPPPTRWHPYEDVHWDKAYFREVARRCDQMAVMMYDTALRSAKAYQSLIADWTQEVLAWSGGKPVLLGVPTYDDAGVGYHHPKIENVVNAVRGIHRGLARSSMPENYQGIAIYCEWETDASEWEYLHGHFLK